MEKIAFKMKLKQGCEAAYEQRHDAIWPKLVDLLRVSGVRDYSIYLDTDSLTLFGVLLRTSDHRMDELPKQDVMQEWWSHMADLMETHQSGNEPIVTSLPCMFHLE